ncbi:Abortive infection phage resistance protein [uncultured Gammaproteobacteria bacterium]
MSINAQLIDQRVEGMIEKIGKRISDELKIRNDPDKLKSAIFILLVAKTLLELNDEEAIEGMVEGGGDFGVDAVYFGLPTDGEFPVTLIQGKYKRTLDGDSTFPETAIVKMFEALRTIFDPAATYEANKRLTRRVEELRSLIREGNIPQVRVIFCNNGQKWHDHCQQRIDNSGLGSLVQWEYAGPDGLIGLMRARKAVETKIQLTGRAIVEDYPYMRAMIGRMSVLELARLFDEFGDVLLERNIRRYLGLTVRVNEEIAATLKDSQQRPKFYFYNNGITIICSKFGYNPFAEKDWNVQITGLQIVNGGQTSKTIQQMKKELGAEIGDAQVLVRIYELPVNDEDLVQRITQATNSQNPVDLRDLRSNDPRQKTLGESIHELGFSYRRQRNDGSTPAIEITSATAAEAILAVWRDRPHQARFLTTEHFGKLYEHIFTQDLNGAQTVMAVLLLRIAENKRKRPPENAPDFLQYGSRFIAMLMGRFLLDDLGIDLSKLTHTTFADARQRLEEKSETYFQRALKDIEKALSNLHHEEDVSLQKLSATFRRYDLVERLRGGVPISVAN